MFTNNADLHSYKLTVIESRSGVLLEGKSKMRNAENQQRVKCGKCSAECLSGVGSGGRGGLMYSG